MTHPRAPVREADREAAKAFWNAHVAGWQEQSHGQAALVQAFARHRIRAYEAGRVDAEQEAYEAANPTAIRQLDDGEG